MDKLYDLIHDINPKEICSHIESGNLGDWCNAWRTAAKETLQPKTNADRIQAMSDEELCEFLMCDVICDQKMKPDCADCEKCVLDWLRESVEQPATMPEEDKQDSGLVEEE